MKRRARRKVTRPTKAQRERAARRDWNVTQEILFRVTQCHRCGTAPGPLHAVVHRLWVEETRALEAWYRIPSQEVSR